MATAGVLLIFSPASSPSQSVGTLTPAEREWLAARTQPLLVGVTDVPPQAFKDETDKLRGLAIDFYDEIAPMLGLRFVWKAYPTWNDLLEAGKREEIDIVFAAHDTEKRRAYFDFSEPYVRVDNGIVVSGTISGPVKLSTLRGKRVLANRGSAVLGYLNRNFPELGVEASTNAEGALLAVATGEADAAIVDSLRAAYYINLHDLDDLRVGGRVDYDYDLAFAVTRQHPLLASILTKALAEIPHTHRDSLYLKWSYVADPPLVDRELLNAILLTVMVLLLMLGVSAFWNRRLREEIEHSEALRQRLALAKEDVDEARRTAEIEARTDPLTGVPNRRSFMERLAIEHARFRRDATPFALMMLDLDHFKALNDEHGHTVGDQVLIAIGDLLTQRVGDVTAIGRMGGEEFAVLLSEAGLETALRLADELRQAVRGLTVPSNVGPINLSASFGVAEVDVSDTIDTLLIRVDRALYEAKEAGRNQVQSSY